MFDWIHSGKKSHTLIPIWALHPFFAFVCLFACLYVCVSFNLDYGWYILSLHKQSTIKNHSQSKKINTSINIWDGEWADYIRCKTVTTIRTLLVSWSRIWWPKCFSSMTARLYSTCVQRHMCVWGGGVGVSWPRGPLTVQCVGVPISDILMSGPVKQGPVEMTCDFCSRSLLMLYLIITAK